MKADHHDVNAVQNLVIVTCQAVGITHDVRSHVLQRLLYPRTTTDQNSLTCLHQTCPRRGRGGDIASSADPNIGEGRNLFFLS